MVCAMMGCVSSIRPEPTDPPTTLSPLPPPPVDRSGGYGWAVAMIGGVVAIVLVTTGYGWFTLPGFGPTAGAGWWLYTSLLITLPAGLLLSVLACAGVAAVRRVGGRRWPAPLQALLPVLLVLGVVFLLVHSFFYTDW